MEKRPRRPDDERREALPAEGGNVASLRLEDIGDLHYEAATFSTALDYYQRILQDPAAEGLDPERLLAVYRKSIDAALNLGDLDRAELFLDGAMDWIEHRLAVDGDERRRLAAPILGSQAGLYALRGAYRDALHVCKQAFTVLAVTDNHLEVANLQVTMGICHHRLGRLDKAEEFYTDALATYRRIDDELGMAVLYKNLAVLAKNACDWDRALDLQRRAIELTSAHGATHLLCRLHLNEGIILRKSGRHAEARGCFEKCIRLARSLGDLDRQAKASLALGQLEMLDGHLLRAEELVLAGKNLSDQAGYRRESIIADEYLGDILQARGDHERALYNYGIGLEKARRIGPGTDLEGELLRRTAEAQMALGRHEPAIEAARLAIEVCEGCGEVYELGFCRLVLARALDARGADTDADDQYRRAVAVFREQRLRTEAVRVVLDCLETRGRTVDIALVYDLRRHLVEALADESITADQSLYGSLLAGLTRAQLRLGEVDEALLSVSELDRAVAVSGETGRDAEVQTLRREVEEALVGDDTPALPFAPLGGSVDGDQLGLHVETFLAAAVGRAGAEAGCVVLNTFTQAPRFTGSGLGEHVADGLEAWFSGGDDPGPSVPRIVTRIDTEPRLVRALGEAAGAADSALVVPVSLPGKFYGFLFLLIHSGDAEGRPSFRPSLEFLTASAGFLASGLSEAERNIPVAVAPRPEPAGGEAAFSRIITADPGMHELLEVVRKVAASDLTVLLQGETGTGKGLLAHSIHDLSRRRDQRFQSVNCAAIPESLLESELFGHVKGSFTGAYGDKKGLVAEAEGGTIFLDEIGKLPLAMQGKLLHFIDTRVIRPVGSNLEQTVDVRIICATKTDLQTKVERGEFLEDLYYRLLDFPVNVPPLRDRGDDVRLLVPHFISAYARQAGLPVPGCTSAFLDALAGATWQGNVRELVKVVNRAIVLAHGEPMLRLEHLPEALGGAAGSDRDDRITPLKETLGLVEAREIAKALKRCGGNKAEASRTLGISYPNLLNKIRKYSIVLD